MHNKTNSIGADIEETKQGTGNIEKENETMKHLTALCLILLPLSLSQESLLLWQPATSKPADCLTGKLQDQLMVYNYGDLADYEKERYAQMIVHQISACLDLTKEK